MDNEPSKTKLFLPTVVEDPALRCGSCEGCGCRPSLPPLSFTKLTGPTLNIEEDKAFETSQPCINIRAFGHKLYLCRNGGTIEVFNYDLKPMHKWSNADEWGDVNDVTELPGQQIAVAGSKGLFVVSAGGRTISTLERGPSFCSCAAVEGRLVACSNSQRQLLQYGLSGSEWKRMPMIREQMPWVKLAVADRNTIICGCSNPDKIIEVTKDSKLRERRALGREGHRYLLCAADAKGAILVIDKRNGDLKVCDSIGGWHMFGPHARAKSPQSAVVIKNRLCVASDGGDRLLLYTSTTE